MITLFEVLHCFSYTLEFSLAGYSSLFICAVFKFQEVFSGADIWILKSIIYIFHLTLKICTSFYFWRSILKFAIRRHVNPEYVLFTCTQIRTVELLRSGQDSHVPEPASCCIALRNCFILKMSFIFILFGYRP